MSKQMKGYLITAGIAAIVVWAANNIDQVDAVLGDGGWF